MGDTIGQRTDRLKLLGLAELAFKAQALAHITDVRQHHTGVDRSGADLDGQERAIMAPQVQREGVVPGTPIVIAARAARVLQDYGFTTKRFSDDSLWGLRGADDIAARLRYAPRSSDSTRVLVELWGKCQDPRSCMQGDVAVILARISQPDEPPQ